MDLPIAETLIGLGGGILYLSLWASVVVFPELQVSRGSAFLAMFAVTGILAVLAATRRSERVALLGLAGGLLTPALLNSGTPDQAVLAAYLLVLGGTFVALGIRERFRFVEGAAFLGSLLYLPAFLPDAQAWSTTAASTVVSAICALYAVAFSVGVARSGRGAPAARLTLLTVDALAFAGIMRVIYSGDDTSVGIAYLILAAVLLATAYAGARGFGVIPRRLALAYGYLGLGAVTCALPVLLHRFSLLDALSVEGALLIVLAARRGDRNVAVGGSVLLAVAGIGLLFETLTDPPANTALSALAASFAIAFGALSFARMQIARLALDWFDGKQWASAIGFAANALAIVGISRILLDALGGPSWMVAVPSHAQVAISLAWTAYAAALFGFGVRRNDRALLAQGLVLFVATMAKAFIIDLSNVDMAWRIASFVVLGVVCIGASAWYMRSRLGTAVEA